MRIRNKKTAIPTDDGETISPDLQHCRAFMIVSRKECGATKTELRWNLLSEILTSKKGRFYNLCDCKRVIVSNDCSCHTVSDEKEYIITDKKLITEVISEL